MPAANDLSVLPRLLDALLGASPAVVYATDDGWWQGELRYASSNIASLVGMDRKLLEQAPQHWLAHVIEPASVLVERLHAAIAAGSTQANLHYWLRHEDGSERYIQDDVAIHRDERGVVVELVGSLIDITERHALLQQFERLSDQLPGVLYQCRMGADGTLSFPLISSGIEHLFGLSFETVSADPRLAFERVHADDVEGLWRSVHRSARRMEVWRWEFRYRHPNGKVLWVYGHATPQPESDGSILWHGFCEDVTERKTAQMGLVESERRYRFIVENVSDLILLMDVEGRCRFVSPSVKAVLGYAPERLEARSLLEFLPPDDAPRVQRLVHEASCRGDTLRMEVRIRHQQGHYVWLETSCSPYTNPVNGRYEWVLAVSRDITDRKHRELKLHELSTTDSMTGALNRGAFLGCLRSALEAADHTVSRLSLIIFDIDHFKEINDTWGHAAGDLVLACVGEICRTTLRGQDVFGRIGGEEFALVLSGQSLNEAVILAERLRKKFEGVRVEFHGHWLHFTVSFGAAERHTDEGMESLLHRTDMGLYAAKRNGRNRVHQAPAYQGDNRDGPLE
ncbi:hypothetical protein GCM10027040_34060 [Halomonas shantousis]